MTLFLLLIDKELYIFHLYLYLQFYDMELGHKFMDHNSSFSWFCNLVEENEYK